MTVQESRQERINKQSADCRAHLVPRREALGQAGHDVVPALHGELEAGAGDPPDGVHHLLVSHQRDQLLPHTHDHIVLLEAALVGGGVHPDNPENLEHQTDINTADNLESPRLMFVFSADGDFQDLSSHDRVRGQLGAD